MAGMSSPCLSSSAAEQVGYGVYAQHSPPSCSKPPPLLPLAASGKHKRVDFGCCHSNQPSWAAIFRNWSWIARSQIDCHRVDLVQTTLDDRLVDSPGSIPCVRFSSEFGDEEVRRQREILEEEKIPSDEQLVLLDRRAIASLLQKPLGLQATKRLRAHIFRSSLGRDVYLGNLLISNYRKNGALEDARSVFDEMLQRDIVSWNTLIGAYIKHEKGKQAIQLFRQMRQQELQPSSVTFLCVLSACTMPPDLKEGRIIHACLVEHGFESDVVVGNALISMYGKCKAIEQAGTVFEKMHRHDAVSWNALIAAFYGHGKKAFQIFTQMQQQVNPDRFTFINLLSACSSPATLMEGRVIHDCISHGKGKPDIVVENSLLNMYNKCGALEEAREVFDKIHERNVVSWTTMITAYVQHGHGSKALQLFHEMLQQDVQPNKVTFVSVLGACARSEGEVIHAHIANRGFESDVFVGSALVSMYGKCGAVEEARSVFDNTEQRTVVSWNSMITAFTQNGLHVEALSVFLEMQKEGVEPNRVTYTSILSACTTPAVLEDGRTIHARIKVNGFGSDVAVASALIHMYGNCGKLEDARLVFDNMLQHNVFTWSAMIGAYAQHGISTEAFHLFQEMQRQGVDPDEVTYMCILGACVTPDAIEEGRAIHACIVDVGYEADVAIGNTLINMYNKCGALQDAGTVFDKLEQHSLVSWNAMLSAYCQHGYGKETLQLFEKMQQEGMQPNEVTFLVLLTACSHAGLVEKGHGFFAAMTEKHRILPMLEHYSCMIDLLGRSGQLEDAKKIVDKMPLYPDAYVWTTLLNACRLHGDVKHGEFAAKRLLELDPSNMAAYVMLSNLYASNGRWDDVESVREAMVARGLNVLLGCSWIEVDNRVHEFFVANRAHPESEAIDAELERLSREMSEAGYITNTRPVLHNVEEELKQLLLCCHTEKPAIAYGLIRTPPGTTLCVTKNGRSCIDCHTSTKFISKLVMREIIVRDTNQFHHFNNGVCSCRDHW